MTIFDGCSVRTLGKTDPSNQEYDIYTGGDVSLAISANIFTLEGTATCPKSLTFSIIDTETLSIPDTSVFTFDNNELVINT